MEEQLQELRSTPAFLADESITALCARPPPEGLLSGPLALGSLLARLNQTAEGAKLCKGSDACASPLRTPTLCRALASELKQRTLGIARGSKFRRCAVVGSSGHLRGLNAARIIDSHDAVMRFNLAPVGPHAQDVGSRTTWRVMSHFPWRVVVSGKWAPSMRVPQGEVRSPSPKRSGFLDVDAGIPMLCPVCCVPREDSVLVLSRQRMHAGPLLLQFVVGSVPSRGHAARKACKARGCEVTDGQPCPHLAFDLDVARSAARAARTVWSGTSIPQGKHDAQVAEILDDAIDWFDGRGTRT